MNKQKYKLNLQLFAGGEDAIAVLNGVRNDLAGDYAERIPEATRENIESVGNTILGNQQTTNSFFTALLNRISKTVIKHADDMEDIYSAFGGEQELPFGKVIQKIFVDICNAHPFEGASTSNPASMLAVEKGTIHVEYTSVDRKMFYKQTISTAELKEAFMSADKLSEFVQAIIGSMARSFSYDKYLMDTQLLATHCKYVRALKGAGANNVRVITVPETVAKYNKTTKEIEWTSTGAKAFLKLIKKVSGSLKYPHKIDYAPYDVAEDEIDDKDIKTIKMVRTPISKQVIALENSTMAEIDVDALAVLFHLEPANIMAQTVELEDGAMGGTDDVYVGGFLARNDLVERGKSYEDADSFKNPEHLYVNFWNHYWGYRAVSKFGDFLPIVFTAYTPEAGE